VEELGLELGHVDVGGALGLARLALEAEVEGLEERLVGQAVGGQGARHHQAEGVGAAPGGVLLVAGDHVARAHRASARLAAGTHARAHLDRPREAPLVREVEDGLFRLDGAVLGADPEVVARVGSGDDLARVHPAVGVEGPLDRLEAGVDLRAE
jgi:hypothetical protein